MRIKVDRADMTERQSISYGEHRSEHCPLVDIRAYHIHQCHWGARDAARPVERGYLFRELRQERRDPLHKNKRRDTQTNGQSLEALEKRMRREVQDQPAAREH